jgi:hypothetical protein
MPRTTAKEAQYDNDHHHGNGIPERTGRRGEQRSERGDSNPEHSIPNYMSRPHSSSGGTVDGYPPRLQPMVIRNQMHPSAYGCQFLWNRSGSANGWRLVQVRLVRRKYVW